jgi:hypothetical protein
MSNEEKAARLEGMAAKKDFAAEHAKSAVFGGGTWVAEFTADAAVLREAAQLMGEQEAESLLTERDWKTMYEAQERDMAALRKELEGLREKAEMLEWYLRSSDRCAWLCGMLGQPFSWLEEPKPQAFSALRAARGEK